ncbi:MAG TPA: hypothetical protein VLJ58_19720 [Ramlibacter sp.]|nr:hypothetical protein [Ramlibacter sp.]
MTRIHAADQLAALIRAQLAPLRQRAGRRGAPALAADAPATAASTDLAGLVAQRIHSIGADDPQRERKAFRIFLETVLLSELGQDLVNDPSFQLMVDQVQSQMESDPELARATRQAAQALLQGTT